MIDTGTSKFIGMLNDRVERDPVEQLLKGGGAHPDILRALGLESFILRKLGLELLAEVWYLRKALVAVERDLTWDEEGMALAGDPVTLEALVAQVEQVQSDIISVWLRGETYEF